MTNAERDQLANLGDIYVPTELDLKLTIDSVEEALALLQEVRPTQIHPWIKRQVWMLEHDFCHRSFYLMSNTFVVGCKLVPEDIAYQLLQDVHVQLYIALPGDCARFVYQIDHNPYVPAPKICWKCGKPAEYQDATARLSCALHARFGDRKLGEGDWKISNALPHEVAGE